MLTIIPGEAAHVRWAFNEYIKQGSPTIIARIFNEKKVGKPTRTGAREGKWEARNIHNILRNPLYAGLIRSSDGETLYAARHESIITQELWKEVNRRMDANAEEVQARIAGKRLNLTFPLNGILRCGGCGIKDKFIIDFANIIEESDIEKRFFTALVKMGAHVKIESNRR